MPDAEAAPILASADSRAASPTPSRRGRRTVDAAATRRRTGAGSRDRRSRPSRRSQPQVAAPAAPPRAGSRSASRDERSAGRSRRGSRSPAADPRAAPEDRRTEGRAAAAGVHDSAGDARPRAFPRRRSPHEAAAPGRARATATATVRTAARASPDHGLRGRAVDRAAAAVPHPAGSAPVSRRVTAAARSARARLAPRPQLATASHFSTAYFVVKSAENGRLCR